MRPDAPARRDAMASTAALDHTDLSAWRKLFQGLNLNASAGTLSWCGLCRSSAETRTHSMQICSIRRLDGVSRRSVQLVGNLAQPHGHRLGLEVFARHAGGGAVQLLALGDNVPGEVDKLDHRGRHRERCDGIQRHCGRRCRPSWDRPGNPNRQRNGGDEMSLDHLVGCRDVARINPLRRLS